MKFLLKSAHAVACAAGFVCTAVACSEPAPQITVQPAAVIVEPIPASAANDDDDAGSVVDAVSAPAPVENGIINNLTDPSNDGYCDSVNAAWAGTFSGNLVPSGDELMASRDFTQSVQSDGTYVTTITLSDRGVSYGTDPVHGQTRSESDWSLSIQSLPIAAPSVDTFAVGKAEPVVVTPSGYIQFTGCAEDGTSTEGEAGDDDDETPPAATLTITRRDANGLAGALVIQASAYEPIQTLTFDLAYPLPYSEQVCCFPH